MTPSTAPLSKDQEIELKANNVHFNPDVQSQVARLLASENIRVIIGNFSTAYFDVKNRVLGLPVWNTDSKEIADLLVGHEVGHALYTPEDGITKYKERFPNVSFDIGNIVEDIRIERLILKKYPGLLKSFKVGYTDFKEKDFFKINDKCVDQLAFVDRLNIKGKLRSLVDISFNEEEAALYNRCLIAETYEEVLDICEDIINYIKENGETPPSPQETGKADEPEAGETGKGFDDPTNNDTEAEDTEADSGTEGNSEDGSENDEKPNGKASNTDSSDQEDESNSPTGSSDGDVDPEEGDEELYNNQESGGNTGGFDCSTQQHFDENVKDEFQSNNEELGRFVEAPKGKKMLEHAWPIETVQEHRRNGVLYDSLMADAEIQSKWIQFKNETKKNVNVLVKEFERKKAAHRYSRATISRTGKLDVNKLHSYKYDDQIFKSMTSLSDSKNHGMMIFIDMSGSMDPVYDNVIRQTIQLATFCKAVDIPFKVYGFTTGYGWSGTPSGVSRADYAKSLSPGFNIDMYSTCIIELLNSDLKKSKFNTALKELYIQGACDDETNIKNRSWNMKSYNRFDSKLERFCGTPLYETLLFANEAIIAFRKKHNVEKMNTLFITDGGGQSVNTQRFNHPDPEVRHEVETACSYFSPVWIKVGKTSVNMNGYKNYNLYENLVDAVKKNTGSTLIGFFLAESATRAKHHSTTAMCCGSLTKWKKLSSQELEDEYKKMNKQARKKNSPAVVIEGGFNYDNYFVISKPADLNIEEEEFSIPEKIQNEDDRTSANARRQLVTAFSKHSKSKKSSRVFLSTFAETIA